MKRLGTVISIFWVLSSPALMAQGNGKGNGNGGNSGGGPQITDFEAVDVTFSEETTDAFMSDGLGAYQTGADDVHAIGEYDQRRMNSGARNAIFNPGICTSGDPSDFAGPTVVTGLYFEHVIKNRSFSKKEIGDSFPSVGTTEVSSENYPHNFYVKFEANGKQYAFAREDDSTGSSSVTSIDLDNDGKADEYVVSMDASKDWELWHKNSSGNWTYIATYNGNTQTFLMETLGFYSAPPESPF